MSLPLELTGLTKVFPTPSGPFIAVKDVNALVETGEFGANMQVSLINDGPVTIWLER